MAIDLQRLRFVSDGLKRAVERQREEMQNFHDSMTSWVQMERAKCGLSERRAEAQAQTEEDAIVPPVHKSSDTTKNVVTLLRSGNEYAPPSIEYYKGICAEIEVEAKVQLQPNATISIITVGAICRLSVAHREIIDRIYSVRDEFACAFRKILQTAPVSALEGSSVDAWTTVAQQEVVMRGMLEQYEIASRALSSITETLFDFDIQLDILKVDEGVGVVG